MLHPKMTVPQISPPRPTTTESVPLVVFTNLLYETAGAATRPPTSTRLACALATPSSWRPAAPDEAPRPPALRRLGRYPLALHPSNARALRACRDSPSPVPRDRI